MTAVELLQSSKIFDAFAVGNRQKNDHNFKKNSPKPSNAVVPKYVVCKKIKTARTTVKRRHRLGVDKIICPLVFLSMKTSTIIL